MMIADRVLTIGLGEVEVVLVVSQQLVGAPVHGEHSEGGVDVAKGGD